MPLCRPRNPPATSQPPPASLPHLPAPPCLKVGGLPGDLPYTYITTACMGLGNVSYQQGQFDDAAEYLGRRCFPSHSDYPSFTMPDTV